MTTFTHNGINIELGPDGKFRATGPDGTKIVTTSLEAAKKKLTVKASFKSFTVLKEMTLSDSPSRWGNEQEIKTGDPRIVATRQELLGYYSRYGRDRDADKDQFRTRVLARLTVTGIREGRSRGSAVYTFMLDQNKSVSGVLKDTPETIAAWLKQGELENEATRLEEAKRKKDGEASKVMEGTSLNEEKEYNARKQ